MKRIYLILFAFTLLFAIAQSNVFAARATNEKMRLAIVDLQSQGVSKVIGLAVTDLIRSDMVDTGRFVVVERSQMDAIMKEHSLQQSGCTDSSCAVELGKMLSANKVLIGEINKLGSDIMITVRIVDVEKGVAEFSTNEKAKNIDAIDKAVKVLVNKLTLRITGKRSLAGETGASAYYLRGIIPGWAQLYADKTLKGGLYLGSFLAVGGVSVYSYFNYKSKKKSYDDLGPEESRDTFDSKYNDYKQSYNIMLYAAGIWGFIYVMNWIDVLFITDSPGVIVSGIPCGNDSYFAFDLYDKLEILNPYASQDTYLNMCYKIKF